MGSSLTFLSSLTPSKEPRMLIPRASGISQIFNLRTWIHQRARWWSLTKRPTWDLWHHTRGRVRSTMKLISNEMARGDSHLPQESNLRKSTRGRMTLSIKTKPSNKRKGSRRPLTQTTRVRTSSRLISKASSCLPLQHRTTKKDHQRQFSGRILSSLTSCTTWEMLIQRTELQVLLKLFSRRKTPAVRPWATIRNQKNSWAQRQDRLTPPTTYVLQFQRKFQLQPPNKQYSQDRTRSSTTV